MLINSEHNAYSFYLFILQVGPPGDPGPKGDKVYIIKVECAGSQMFSSYLLASFKSTLCKTTYSVCKMWKYNEIQQCETERGGRIVM